MILYIVGDFIYCCGGAEARRRMVDDSIQTDESPQRQQAPHVLAAARVGLN